MKGTKERGEKKKEYLFREGSRPQDAWMDHQLPRISRHKIFVSIHIINSIRYQFLHSIREH